MEDGIDLLHLDTHTNPDCKEGVLIQETLQENYDRLQRKFEEALESITLQDIIDQFEEKLHNRKLESSSFLNDEKNEF